MGPPHNNFHEYSKTKDEQLSRGVPKSLENTMYILGYGLWQGLLLDV